MVRGVLQVDSTRAGRGEREEWLLCNPVCLCRVAIPDLILLLLEEGRRSAFLLLDSKSAYCLDKDAEI